MRLHVNTKGLVLFIQHVFGYSVWTYTLSTVETYDVSTDMRLDKFDGAYRLFVDMHVLALKNALTETIASTLHACE